jgi:hypothetical protein
MAEAPGELNAAAMAEFIASTFFLNKIKKNKNMY